MPIGRSSRFFAVCAFVCAQAASLYSQNFLPFTQLRVLETERFHIIFPERSRRTAEALAGFADAHYDRVSALLGVSVRGKIPVTITPHTDLFNGYANPFPYMHIVLFDTPMNPDWTVFRDSLEGLFVHELTHAVSFSSRGPFFDALHAAFGGWVLPVGVNAPYFMVEGVTVAFESLDGFGRANDPLVHQRLSQALRDGRFLTPFQASGVYDQPPLGRAPYEYGGLFSSYLLRRWGTEKYAELWRRIGSEIRLSFDFYRHGFFRMFEETYGLPFQDAWADFASGYAAPALEDNRDGIIEGTESKYAAVVAAGGRVFYLDTIKGEVRAYDPGDGGIRRVLTLDGYAEDIDVSADGSSILVSGYRFAGEHARAVAVEYDAGSGSPTGRTWLGLYRARYFRGGVIGIASDLHFHRLVYRDAAGNERVLATGNATTLFTDPAPIDENRVACIVAENGVRSIVEYDYRTGGAVRLELSADRPGSAVLAFARGLRASGGQLWFAWSSGENGDFYSPAFIENDRILFAERDFSGGVFDPVELNGELYYRGEFSTWDALLRYPERAAELSGTETTLQRAPWNAPSVSREAAPKPAGRERPYLGLSYLNPLRFWLPYPLIRTDGDTTRVDGGGAVSYLSDPTDLNTVLLNAGWDTAGSMVFIGIDWTSLELGVPISARFSDGIEFGADGGLDDPYRATRAALSIGIDRGIGGERLRFSGAFSTAAVLTAEDPHDGSGAYEWERGDPRFAIGASIGLSSFERPAWRLFGSGFHLELEARAQLPDGTVRADAVFRAAFEPAVPLRVTAYGVWDQDGMAVDGSSRTYGAPSFSGVTEYAKLAPDDLTLLAGAEAEWRLFSVEAQTNLSHLYFNRLFGLLSVRGAAFGSGDQTSEAAAGWPIGADGRFVSSVVVSTGAVVSAMPAAALPLRYAPFVWAALRLNLLDDDDPANDYAFGAALSIEW